jgi:hypothetical protein
MFTTLGALTERRALSPVSEGGGVIRHRRHYIECLARGYPPRKECSPPGPRRSTTLLKVLFVSTAKSVLKKRPTAGRPPPLCQPATKSTAAAAQAPTGTIACTASRAIHPATLLLQMKYNLSLSTKCTFIARQCLRSRAVVKQFSFNLVPFFHWHHRSSCTEYRRTWPVRTSLTKRG